MECVTRKCTASCGLDPVARFEPLEPRRMMSASGLSDLGPSHDVGAEFVYVESNNPQPGQNAVIALRRHPATGALGQVGAFATSGTGFGNVPPWRSAPVDGLRRSAMTAFCPG